MGLNGLEVLFLNVGTRTIFRVALSNSRLPL
jgi:hypothetical protein